MNYRHNEDKMCTWAPNRPLYNRIISTPVLTDAANPEPLTLDEVKNHLQMDLTFTEQDDYLTSLIKRARRKYEDVHGVSLKTRSVEIILQNELGNMPIPYGPINAITTALDVDGTVIDPANYEEKNGVLVTPYDWIKLIFNVVDPPIDDTVKEGLLHRVAWEYYHRGDEQKELMGGAWFL